MKAHLYTSVIGVAAVVLSSQTLWAYETGDTVIRAGYAAVDPRDDSRDLKVNGAAIAGTGVGVDSGSALGFTASYIFAPHWGIELLAATPFQHDITAKGLGSLGVPDGTKIGTTKQLPPTVSVQYYFAPADSALQPYLGIGVNYTVFFHESVSSAAKDKLGAHNLQLKNSVGLAAEAGLDWQIVPNWLVNVSVWRIAIRSDASMDSALGKVKTQATIDPWVYMIGAGYRF